MEAKTLQQIKDEVVKKWFKKNWNMFEDMLMASQVSTIELNSILDEVISEYARQIALAACEEQRRLSFEAYLNPNCEYTILSTPPPTEFINQLLNSITMENNNDNKAKFFALYFRQEVMNSDSDGWGIRPVDHNNIYPIDEHDYLELKSLESITDEDAKEIEKLSVDCGLFVRIEFDSKGMPEIVYSYNDYGEETEYTLLILLSQIDYLRSKGYALPYMGLSVEQQQEYGWVKLTEK